MTDKYLFRVTPLRKIGVGLFLTAAAFLPSRGLKLLHCRDAPAVAATLWTAIGTTGEALARADWAVEATRGWNRREATINAAMAGTPSIGWQFLAYIISPRGSDGLITSLEFAYTQGAPQDEVVIMGIYFLGVSVICSLR
jgi:hypothetical protein